MAGSDTTTTRSYSRVRVLKHHVLRTLSLRSPYLFVSLAIFALLAFFSFICVNSSIASLSSIKESRAAFPVPGGAPRTPPSRTNPIPPIISRNHSSYLSAKEVKRSSMKPRGRIIPIASTVNGTSDSPPDDVPTFVITCGSGESDAVGEMKALLKSILMMISSPVHFAFITDSKGALRIRHLFITQLGWAKNRVWVDVHIILDPKLIDRWAAKMGMSVWSHSSGQWGTAKLMIPWIVRDRARAILVDTDMIFMQDPMNLWELFDIGSSTSTSNSNNTEDWIYQLPVERLTSPIYICSCVMLMKLKKIRQHEVYPNLMRFALRQSPKSWYRPQLGLYKPNTGDQGVIFQLIKNYPNLFKRLPVHWARGHCGNYQNALSSNSTSNSTKSNLPVGILHRNCAGTKAWAVKDVASPFFDFFYRYRWHWLRPQHGVKYKIQVRTMAVDPARIGL